MWPCGAKVMLPVISILFNGRKSYPVRYDLLKAVLSKIEGG